MQGKNNGRHGIEGSRKSKPSGLYSSNTRGYVYGDNTPRNKGRVTKVLFIILPFVMIAVLASGFLLGYMSFTEEEAKRDNEVRENENYISLEQQKTLYRTVTVANPLDRSFVPDTVEYNGIEISPLMENQLKKLIDAAKYDGIDLKVIAGYVSFDDQHTAYTEYVDSLLSSGKYTQVKAESIANRKVCDSGNSERQLGLLVEFDCYSKQDFDKTDEYDWLMKYGAEYGFMQRYTEDSEQVTAIDCDYTLWRYIGVENALHARKLGLNFNELIEYLQS